MITVPQCSPLASAQRYHDAILKAVSAFIDSGQYILGAKCTEFESAFAAYIGTSHCIGVANGTDALELILRGLGIGYGDKVATVANTAVATVAAIGRTGAEPRFADIDPDTMTMSASSLRELLKHDSGIRAVIAVHLFGHPADMELLCRICSEHGILIIEDCAQAHGACINGRKTGGFGVAGAFSFYPTKNLGALGDAGAVVTDDENLAQRIRELRQYGWRERNFSLRPGVNSRLDELQAAILLIKLSDLDASNTRRREIAQAYNNGLKSCSMLLPVERQDMHHVYHQYVVRTVRREELIRKLASLGIGTAIHYPTPIHLQPAYGKIPVIVPLVETEACVSQILSLPMYPELSEEAVAGVVNALCAWEN